MVWQLKTIQNSTWKLKMSMGLEKNFALNWLNPFGLLLLMRSTFRVNLPCMDRKQKFQNCLTENLIALFHNYRSCAIIQYFIFYFISENLTRINQRCPTQKSGQMNLERVGVGRRRQQAELAKRVITHFQFY